jgi:hypothetical protein
MKNTSETLTPILAAALAKLAKLTTEKPEPTGDSPCKGTALLRVEYDLKVGSPYQQRIAAAVPWQRILATAMSKLNGVTLEAVVREALADPATEAAGSEIKARAAEAVATLVDATERTCSGKITGVTSVTVLETSSEDFAA